MRCSVGKLDNTQKPEMKWNSNGNRIWTSFMCISASLSCILFWCVCVYLATPFSIRALSARVSHVRHIHCFSIPLICGPNFLILIVRRCTKRESEKAVYFGITVSHALIHLNQFQLWHFFYTPQGYLDSCSMFIIMTLYHYIHTISISHDHNHHHHRCRHRCRRYCCSGSYHDCIWQVPDLRRNEKENNITDKNQLLSLCHGIRALNMIRGMWMRMWMWMWYELDFFSHYPWTNILNSNCTVCTHMHTLLCNCDIGDFYFPSAFSAWINYMMDRGHIE